MSTHDRDERLRVVFARLRREVEPRVPDVARMLARRPAARRVARARLALSLSLAAVVTAALVLLRDQRAIEPGPGREDLARARAVALGGYPWRGPTDFLLELPGVELTRSTPTFDVASTMTTAITLRPPERADEPRGERNPR